MTVVLPTTMTGADAEGSTMLELAAGVAVARADSCEEINISCDIKNEITWMNQPMPRSNFQLKKPLGHQCLLMSLLL